MNKIYEFLNNAARQYYNGNPIMSDEQFDKLADSIGYNAVGAKQHENTEKHYNRMYSLQSTTKTKLISLLCLLMVAAL